MKKQEYSDLQQRMFLNHDDFVAMQQDNKRLTEENKDLKKKNLDLEAKVSLNYFHLGFIVDCITHCRTCIDQGRTGFSEGSWRSTRRRDLFTEN